MIRAVARHDRSIFTEHDLSQRREAGYPPYVRLSNVSVWSASETAARGYAERLADEVRRRLGAGHAAAGPQRSVAPRSVSGTLPSLAGDPTTEPQVLGPNPCVISRAKDRFRFHFIVKSPLGYHVSQALGDVIAAVGPPKGISVSVDVDAYDLM